jgi:hypothetical protein
MRTEVRRLLKRNSQSVLGLTSAKNGDLLYRGPVDWVVVGLFLNWTAIDRFYMYAFAAPLFVPESVLGVGVGERLPRPSSSIRAWPPRWRPELGDADDQLLGAVRAALSEAEPLLDSISTPDGYVRYVDQKVDPSKMNPRYQEEAAYASLIGGRSRRPVQRELEAVLEVINVRRHDRYGNPDQFIQVGGRVTAVLNRLAEGHDAIDLLRDWRQERMALLGLRSGVADRPALPERKSGRGFPQH